MTQPIDTDAQSTTAAATHSENFDTLLNRWLEKFEEQWEPEGHALEEIARQSGFKNHAMALSELVRVDLDRQYQAGNCVELAMYFSRYPQLLRDSRAAMEIAFEDFRARSSRGLHCSTTRWSSLPGVAQQRWFRELSLKEDPAARQLDSNEPQPGGVFGEFTIVCQLGTGALSRVYLAIQGDLGGRYVALKVTRRKLQEPQHLAQLQHTGIIPLYSLHQVGVYSVLCMPYHGAATLADWLAATAAVLQQSHDPAKKVVGTQSPSQLERNGQSLIDTVENCQQRVSCDTIADPMPQATDHLGSTSHSARPTSTVQSLSNPSRSLLNKLRDLDATQVSLWLASRLSAALAHAHARGISHGDIKPANILIRNDGEPALIDFNLARIEGNQDLHYVGGTLPYMAPEQLQALMGRQVTVSKSADVYALGLVLYEVAFGKAAFIGSFTLAECDLQSAIAARKVARPDFAGAKIPLGYRAILEKCLQFDAADRYQSAEELQVDVDAQQQHRPLVYARESWRSRLGKVTRRYPRAFSSSVATLIGLLICMAVSLLALALWQRAEHLRAREALARHLDDLTEATNSLIDTRAAGPWPTPIGQSASLRTTDDRQSRWRRLDREQLAQLQQSEFETCLTTLVFAVERAPTDGSITDAMRELLHAGEVYAEPASRSYLWSELAKAFSGDKLKPIVLGELSLTEATVRLNLVERVLAARLLISSGQPGRALDLLSQRQPNLRHSFLYWQTVGEAQLQMGQPESAILSASFAIQSRPQSHAAYFQRALAASAAGDWQAAKNDCDRAIELAGGADGLYLSQRVLILEKLGELNAAISDIDRVLSLGAESTRLLYIKSRLHSKLGETKEARLSLEAARTLPPIKASDWISRALARASQSPNQAVEDLEQALRIDPKSTSAWQNLAFVHSEYLHDDNAALEALDRLLLIESEHQEGRGGRCVLLARVGKVDQALEDIQFIQDRFPKPLPATVYQVACAYALLSKHRPECKVDAVRFLMRAMQQGYGFNLLSKDPDLDPLRQDADFQRLVELSELSNQ